MSNNYDDYGYDDENKSGLLKKILVVSLIVISIIIIVILLKGCTSGGGNKPVDTFDYENALLNAGKNYFENNKDEYPQNKGECTQVELSTLIEKGLINPQNFNQCDNSKTYLRVCVLENGTKHFTPWVTCENYKSEEKYGESKEGNLNDVLTNESYIEFKFLPQVTTPGEDELGGVKEGWKDEIKVQSYKTLSSTKYYRYRDTLYRWDITSKKYYTTQGDKTNAADVKEYYVVAPNSNYRLYDSKTTEAYKWYTTTQKKEYALGANGEKAFSPQPIDDYDKNEGGVEVNFYYQKELELQPNVTPNLFYKCAATNDKNATVVKFTPKKCGETDNKMIYEIGTVYSCASTTSTGESVVSKIVPNATSKCYETKWKSVKTCDTKSEDCKVITSIFYNWYKYVGTDERVYYPSNSKTAAGEKVYYTEAPIAGAIKDESTKATAYKWYKASTKNTTEYTAVPPSADAKKTTDYKLGSWTEWSTTNPKINDGRTRTIETRTKIKYQEIISKGEVQWVNIANNDKYLTLDEMITLLQNNKYNVKSLEEITNDGTIRYQLKMYIRNKKETK